jgi:hypothetical protein
VVGLPLLSRGSSFSPAPFFSKYQLHFF